MTCLNNWNEFGIRRNNYVLEPVWFSFSKGIPVDMHRIGMLTTHCYSRFRNRIPPTFDPTHVKYIQGCKFTNIGVVERDLYS